MSLQSKIKTTSASWHQHKYGGMRDQADLLAQPLAESLAPVAISELPSSEEEIQQLKLLAEASTRIHSTLDATLVLRYLVDYAVELVQAVRGAVGLVDGEQVVFQVASNNGEWQASNLRFVKGQGLAGATWQSHTHIISNAPYEDSRLSRNFVRKLGFYNAVAVPMLSADGVYLGCFELHNKRGGEDFTARDVALLEHLAIYAALALQNARLFEQQAAATRALELSSQRYMLMFKNNMAAKLLIQPNTGLVVDANDAACRFYGYERLKDMSIAALEHQPSLLSSPKPLPNAVLSGDEFIHATHCNRDGEVKIVEIGISSVELENSEFYFAVIHDVTNRVVAEQALAESQRMTEIILSSICEGVCRIDRDGKILFVNSAVEKLLGYSGYELVGTQAFDHIAATSKKDLTASRAVKQKIKKVIQHGESTRYSGASFRCKNGAALPVEFYASATFSNGEIDGSVLSFVDISERIANEQNIRQLAYTDSLTQLPNRLALRDKLNSVIRKSSKTGKYGVVLFFDVDNFKTVNDSLGHSVGDQLLQQMADSARRGLRRSDTIARHGGDEFVVVAGLMVTDYATAEPLAERIANDLRDAVAKNYTVGGIELHVSISVGTAIFGGAENSPQAEDVLRWADTAMYEAKRRGRARACAFQPAMQEAAKQKLVVERELRLALARNEFVAYLQPKVGVASGRLRGAEVLARWQHPQRGLVFPDSFINSAEECGLIAELGDALFNKVFQQLGDWRDQGLELVPVAINLSASQFNQPRLAEKLSAKMREYQVPGQLIELEITETTLMQNPEQVRTSMLALRQLGVRISVDDFGTGYSSLNYLKKFPLDAIKIDRTFIRDIQADPDDRAITSAIISMAKALQLRTVAEGVETEAQLGYLQGLGCDQFQGWLHSKAMPADEFSALLERSQS